MAAVPFPSCCRIANETSGVDQSSIHTVDIASWTLRQKIKASLPVVFAILFAFNNVACSPESHAYAVRNDSQEPLLYRDFYSRCDEINGAYVSDESWYVIVPGDVENSAAFGTTKCLIVTNLDRNRFAKVDFLEDALYVVRLQNGFPAVEAIDGHSPDRGGNFVILSIIGGGVFLIGMMAAAFIALRFFYRYYLRGNKSARLE